MGSSPAESAPLPKMNVLLPPPPPPPMVPPPPHPAIPTRATPARPAPLSLRKSRRLSVIVSCVRAKNSPFPEPLYCLSMPVHTGQSYVPLEWFHNLTSIRDRRYSNRMVPPGSSPLRSLLAALCACRVLSGKRYLVQHASTSSTELLRSIPLPTET